MIRERTDGRTPPASHPVGSLYSQRPQPHMSTMRTFAAPRQRALCFERVLRSPACSCCRMARFPIFFPSLLLSPFLLGRGAPNVRRPATVAAAGYLAHDGRMETGGRRSTAANAMVLRASLASDCGGDLAFTWRIYAVAADNICGHEGTRASKQKQQAEQARPAGPGARQSAKVAWEATCASRTLVKCLMMYHLAQSSHASHRYNPPAATRKTNSPRMSCRTPESDPGSPVAHLALASAGP